MIIILVDITSQQILISKKTNKYMKHIKTFDRFLTESKLDLFEGALAGKADRELGVYLSEMEPEDQDWQDLYDAIANALGVDASGVMMVDSETHDGDPLSTKIYNYLQSHCNGIEAIETKGFKLSHGWAVMKDPKLNVVRLDDYGFVGFYFTATSKF